VPLLLADAVLVGVLVSVALADSEADGVGVCEGESGAKRREDRAGSRMREEGDK
jgi:hypothetical protein